MDGESDIAAVAALIGDPTRARLLMALADGRALPASVLANEAGVAPSTASQHLGRLLDGALLTVETHGRHRYYRLASAQVASLLEALAQHAPTTPVRSLRQGNRAHALRRGRYCYDHLAGRVGVSIMSWMLERGALVGGDGQRGPQSADRLAAPGCELDYRLTDDGVALMAELGVDLTAHRRTRRPLIRYCVDWTEQRHHLAGGLGAAVADRLLGLGWVERLPVPRAVVLTDAGQAAFARLGVPVPG